MKTLLKNVKQFNTKENREKYISNISKIAFRSKNNKLLERINKKQKELDNMKNDEYVLVKISNEDIKKALEKNNIPATDKNIQNFIDVGCITLAGDIIREHHLDNLLSDLVTCHENEIKC